MAKPLPFYRMSHRLSKALQKGGIFTESDVLSKTKKQLYSLEGFGISCFIELLRALDISQNLLAPPGSENSKHHKFDRKTKTFKEVMENYSDWDVHDIKDMHGWSGEDDKFQYITFSMTLTRSK